MGNVSLKVLENSLNFLFKKGTNPVLMNTLLGSGGSPTREEDQAPVVQTLDSAIQRINHYPADKYWGNQLHYPLNRDLSDG